ncbi:MAG: MBL fold metallo-hydrolase [Syntrophomonadaceae bacterium]|nr:MBL fold metallo-hydrolase [Syntrophomonadaceae bacterium]
MTNLTDNVMLMGNGYFNYYVVGRKGAALVECGTRAGASIFAKQWAQLKNKPDVQYIVALHSHFDHVCGIPVLRKIFPDAKLVASKQAQKILSKERIVKELFRNDAIVSESYLKNGLLQEKPDTHEEEVITVDMAVGEGDTVQLGEGFELRILDAPGHSVCSIGAYFEGEQAMFVSDAAGYRISKDLLAPVFFQNYGSYINTIKKFMSYPTEAVGVAHGDVPVGKEVEQFYKQAVAAAEEGFNYIKTRLAEGVGEDELAEELFKRYIRGGLAFYPREMMLGAMHLLIQSVKAEL